MHCAVVAVDICADVRALCAMGAEGGTIARGEWSGAASLGGSIGAMAEEVGFCLPLDSESACLRSLAFMVMQYQRIPVPHMYSAVVWLVPRI